MIFFYLQVSIFCIRLKSSKSWVFEVFSSTVESSNWNPIQSLLKFSNFLNQLIFDNRILSSHCPNKVYLHQTLVKTFSSSGNYRPFKLFSFNLNISITFSKKNILKWGEEQKNLQEQQTDVTTHKIKPPSSSDSLFCSFNWSKKTNLFYFLFFYVQTTYANYKL